MNVLGNFFVDRMYLDIFLLFGRIFLEIFLIIISFFFFSCGIEGLKKIKAPSNSSFSRENSLLTLSTSSSTVNVLDVRTVPLVVKHRIAGFLLLANAKAAFALSATLATCSGSKVALEAGGQSLASAPLARPSSSFRTETKMHNMSD